MPKVDLFDILHEIVAETTEDFGREVLEQRKAELSVPASVAVGKRGGRRYLPSMRGEHPRARTGGLARATVGDMAEVGDFIQYVISNDHPGAANLQENMKRPILNDLADKKGEEFIDRIVNAIQEGMA